MCQSFWFLSWLIAFLGSSPTLPVCTLTGCQVIFPKHRLDLVSLWLRKLLTLPVVWRPQSRPRSLAPAALNLTCRLGSLLTLPRERALGSLISLAASVPFVIFFSSWNALSHFHPLHFFKSPHLILGPLWSPLEILSKWIMHFCSHSPLFYFHYCLYHVLCLLNSGCGDRVIVLSPTWKCLNVCWIKSKSVIHLMKNIIIIKYFNNKHQYQPRHWESGNEV